MKAKAIWFGESEGSFNAVYSQELRKQFEELVDFIPQRLGKKDLENVDTKDVEYLFSTWGMNWFTDEEVDKYFPSLKAIFYSAGTVQGFARPFLEKGVKIFSAWKANAVPDCTVT